MQFSFDPELREIADKVEDGERLTFDEGVALYNSSDLNAVGKLADFVIVDGDPLADISILQDKSRILTVAVGGQVMVEREAVKR